MSVLLTLPLVVPLAAAALTMALFRMPRTQRVVAVIALLGMLAASITLLVTLVRRDTDPIASVALGDWPAPFGIALVADLLAALLLTVASVVLLAVKLFTLSQPGSAHSWGGFVPVYLVLAAGVALSFLTADLFTLFVGFELTLMSSYVLLTFEGRAEQVRAGMTYTIVNLLGTTMFLVAVAATYAATGTVSLAELATAWPQLPEALQLAIGLLLLFSFGLKSAVFPLFSWLPDSYPTAPTPVTAVFAALLTKVGVYAIIRTQTLMGIPPDDGPSILLMVTAGLTMFVGVLGAIAQDDVKRILSFHSVSQIGYMIFGLALFSLAGLAGAVFYLVHYIVVKVALFLVAGVVEQMAGTSALRRVGGLAAWSPPVAALFALPALSLAGVPPLSGFTAKLALVQAGFDAGAYALTGVSLLVGLLTLMSMAKIWSGVFWGARAPTNGRLRRPALGLLLPLAALVGVTLLVTVAAEPLYVLSLEAAGQLLEPTAYAEAVLGR